MIRARLNDSSAELTMSSIEAQFRKRRRLLSDALTVRPGPREF